MTIALTSGGTRERPILFSSTMIRALLDGSKIQTRRIVKPQPNAELSGYPYWNIGGYRLADTATNPLRCPYGQPGDRLWVRETWATAILHYNIVYAADGEIAASRRIVNKWRPSIFMPRWASRITLEITSVRVDKLGHLTYDDAVAEGVGSVEEFKALWCSINGTWDDELWVWIVEFRKV